MAMPNEYHNEPMKGAGGRKDDTPRPSLSVGVLTNDEVVMNVLVIRLDTPFGNRLLHGARLWGRGLEPTAQEAILIGLQELESRASRHGEDKDREDREDG